MKEKFSLVGVDGNAFSVLAYVNMAMRKCGKSPKERNAYMRDATSSNYDYLLAKSQEIINQLNK